MPGPRPAAFTLLEILVVLALVAVGAGLIVVRMGGSLGQQELREAAGRFAHTARTVRELAVSTQKTYAIELDLDRAAYGVVTSSGRTSSEEGQAVQTSWLKSGRWPETVRVANYQTPTGSRATGGTQRLEFFPDGTSSGASIRLAGQENECHIVVRPHNGQVVFGDVRTRSFAPDQYDLGD